MKYDQAPAIIAKAESMHSPQLASPNMSNTGPRETYGQSGGFKPGGHAPQVDLHTEDHKNMMAAQPGQTTPIQNGEYNRILAQANQGCSLCQAFVAGVRRAGKSQVALKQQTQAANKPAATPIGPVPRMAQPSTYRAMAGADVNRSGGRPTYRSATTGTAVRVARAQAADQLRARRLAGQHAVNNLTRDPGEALTDFIVRQQKVRGHAENAYDRMLGGKNA